MTLKEKIEDYWDARPCNVRHSDAPIGSYHYSESVTARKLRVEPHIPRFAEFDRWRGKDVLDLGCGIGTQALMFAAAGANVVAIDGSRVSLDIAKARARAEGLQGQISFIHGDIEATKTYLPFFPLAQRFDLVHCFGVLHHTPKPVWPLEYARLLLAKGGELRIMVYHKWAVKWLQTLGWRWWTWEKRAGKVSEAQSGCPYTTIWTRSSISRLLDARGFSVLEMEVDHIFPYRVAEYLQHRWVREWYWKCLPRCVFRWLERHFGLHLMVRAKLK